MAHVHLLVGSGTLQRSLLERVAGELSKGARSEIRRVEGADWHTLLTENRGRGLFDESVVVIVDDPEKMGKIPPSMADLIEPKGASSVILVPCASEASVAAREILSLCSVSKSAQPSPWSRERDDIIKSAAERNGVRIAGDAVMLIKEFFDDVGEAEAETEKLALACSLGGRKTIEKSDVESLCLSDDSRAMLRLLDGVCNGKAMESICSLESLQKNSELLQVLFALHNRLRLALYAAAHPKEAASFSRALGARDYAQRQARTAAGIYGKERLLGFITGLARINANEKSGQGASWRDLGILLIDLLSCSNQDRL